MVEVGVASANDPTGPKDAVALVVMAGPDGPALCQVGAAQLTRFAVPVNLDLPACGARAGFTAKLGEVLVLRDPGSGPLVLLTGLGPAGPIAAQRWRLVVAAAVRAAGRGGVLAVIVPAGHLGGAPGEAGAALAEGAVLASYRFDEFRSYPRGGGAGSAGGVVDRVELVLDGADPLARAEFEAGVARGVAAARATTWARDLINTPPSDLTPVVLAERVETALGESTGVTVEIWDEHRISDERMGGLLGVARGSDQPPRFVRADYSPADPQAGADGRVPHLVLVGKGITFDSGGLSLKTAEGMTTMKTDMSGAAIVLGAVSACASSGVRVSVTALAPLTENMPGGSAVKPGDVLRIRNGATIEVLNTDAEGRLVLADALSLAAELAPHAIIDVATLTGAAGVALGPAVAPLFGTDERLTAALVAAGERSGERLWPMPMPEDYRELIDSDVADMKNVGRGGQAGAITAALLLSRFVGEVAWAHLDIAGTGRSAESSGILSKGGTAFGLRALLQFLRAHDDWSHHLLGTSLGG